MENRIEAWIMLPAERLHWTRNHWLAYNNLVRREQYTPPTTVYPEFSVLETLEPTAKWHTEGPGKPWHEMSQWMAILITQSPVGSTQYKGIADTELEAMRKALIQWKANYQQPKSSLTAGE